MQLRILKYLLDIESVITELEAIKIHAGNDFHVFSSQIVLQRAAERGLEIIGEAVRKLLEISPDIGLSSAKKIIGLRNIIAHAYDSVEPELIWAIIQRDIPRLQEEIVTLKNTLP
ncbi:MAG: DUF86 domain-containing protein [Flavobacteriales bacterium]|nr:DUF86 domain-containing protein [Flavobacteriales bacterium]